MTWYKDSKPGYKIDSKPMYKIKLAGNELKQRLIITPLPSSCLHKKQLNAHHGGRVGGLNIRV